MDKETLKQGTDAAGQIYDELEALAAKYATDEHNVPTALFVGVLLMFMNGITLKAEDE